MDQLYRFVHPVLFCSLLAILIFCCVIKWFWSQQTIYRYALVDELYRSGREHKTKRVYILNGLRFMSLFLLALAIGQPQKADKRNHIIIDGIDIVLALDLSGSMQFIDEPVSAGGVQLSRLEIAKKEAKRFIDKRDHDAIGLVIFANDAVSRCPVTYDKIIVKDCINQLVLGIVDPQGTVLSKGLLTAVNRLRRSSAKSKVVILLTDGEPSPEDVEPSVAIRAAQQCGIKVYTIGIGSEKDEYQFHPFYGMIPKPKINKELLTQIAEQTGGKFFLARDARDMATIYDTIDALEKTEHEVPHFTQYTDWYVPLLLLAGIIISIEILIAQTVWFGI